MLQLSPKRDKTAASVQLHLRLPELFVLSSNTIHAQEQYAPFVINVRGYKKNLLDFPEIQFKLKTSEWRNFLIYLDTIPDRPLSHIKSITEYF